MIAEEQVIRLFEKHIAQGWSATSFGRECGGQSKFAWYRKNYVKFAQIVRVETKKYHLKSVYNRSYIFNETVS